MLVPARAGVQQRLVIQRPEHGAFVYVLTDQTTYKLQPQVYFDLDDKSTTIARMLPTRPAARDRLRLVFRDE